MGEVKPPLPLKSLPEPPPLTVKSLLKWAGPSLILGSLSIGGFEAYHAGYMGAKGFIRIFWLYWVASFFQLFLNREIARWTMATGETTLQGYARLKKGRLWTWLVVLSCYISSFWPAWITGAAAAAAAASGVLDWKAWSWIGIGAVFVLFALSKYAYNALEVLMWVVWIVGGLGLIFFGFLMTTPKLFGEAFIGWFSFGVIPAGISLTFIGPFLQQPAGIAWNLFHTYWVREKGMGMGKYIGKVTGLVAAAEEVSPVGVTFNPADPQELHKWKGWMRLNTVTLVIFWIIIGGGLFTFFASLVGYSALVRYGVEAPSGWKIAIVLAELFGKVYGPAMFMLFAFVLVFSLFDSQFATLDGLARISTDVLWVEHADFSRRRTYRFWYFVFLIILVIAAGAAVPVGTPYTIWLFVAWLGALNLPLYLFLTLYINNRFLPEAIRPRWYDNLFNAIYGLGLIVYFIAWTFLEPPEALITLLKALGLR